MKHSIYNKLLPTLKTKTPARLKYPKHLWGSPEERSGGYKATREMTYGGRFGGADGGRSLTKEEIEALTPHWKEQGIL